VRDPCRSDEESFREPSLVLPVPSREAGAGTAPAVGGLVGSEKAVERAARPGATGFVDARWLEGNADELQ